MREYFRGWKRKFGVLTLMVACVLMTAWIGQYRDAFVFEFNRLWPSYGLISSFGGFRITRIGLLGGEERIEGGRTITSVNITDDLPPEFSRGDARIVRYRTDKVEFYSESEDGTLTKLWLVPYWSIVISLALLSAYLLLGKPGPQLKPPALVREYFKGWKRKAGCVTLVVACSLAAGWMRSFTICDYFHLPARRDIASATGSFLLITSAGYEGDRRSVWATVDSKQLSEEMNSAKWVWQFAGFGRGAIHISYVFSAFIWRIPYWSITLPLTLISAWLLLSKPRSAKQQPVPYA